jgi:hypothetical protein
MDYPRNIAVPSHISSFSRLMAGPVYRNQGAAGTPASFGWGSANAAVYIPLWLPWPYNVRRLFWVNGTTAAGNSDIGIYSPKGAQLYHSGSTANSGASVPQYVTPSPDLLLQPGFYFLAWSNDGTTTRAFGNLLATITGRMCGLYQQASAEPLPSPATFAAYAGVGLPLIGITNTASGF